MDKSMVDDITDYLNGKVRTHSFLFKKYPELDSLLDEHFKEDVYLNHRDNNITPTGMRGNTAERLYAYVNGVGYCEVCGKRTRFKNKSVGYFRFCGECGATAGNLISVANAKKKANHHCVCTECLCCGKVFTFVREPNNKCEHKRNKKFCSLSCRSKYMHLHMSDEQKNEISNRKKKTCLERYGDVYVINSQHTRNKTKEKLGVDRPQYLDNYGEICKAGYIKKHGHKFTHSEDSIERMRLTKLKRYGSIMTPTSRYKTYEFPSGKTVEIQGYEDLAITRLLETHNENDLVVGRKAIENVCGSFVYVKSGRSHVYYPDIYVRSENKMIEVKSPFTYTMHSDVNELKRRCVIDRGFLFEFWVITANRYRNGNRTIKKLDII